MERDGCDLQVGAGAEFAIGVGVDAIGRDL
jgi:hypothetical protein